MRSHGQKRHGENPQNGYSTPTTTNVTSTIQSSNQDKRNGNSVFKYEFKSTSGNLPGFNINERMISESNRAREYTIVSSSTSSSNTREQQPREGMSLQMFPTDLSKKTGMVNYVAKKRKVDPQSISPPTAYGALLSLQTCICPCCGNSFPNFQIFMSHMESHIARSNNSTLNICPACGERSEDFESFTNHVFGHCIVQGPGICCISCKMTFDTAEDYQRHYQELHVVAVFKCIICNEILDNMIALQMHFSTFHRTKYSYCRCRLCPHLTFHDKISAEVHVSMNHFKQYLTKTSPVEQLAVCGPSASAENKQTTVVNDKFPECAFLYECSYCPTKFRDTYTQMSHILEKHGEEVKKDSEYIREQNNFKPIKITISPTYLYTNAINAVESADNHKYGLPIPKTFSCDQCPLTDIPTEADLLMHKKTHQHLKAKAKNMSLHCAYCNEICKTRNELENHMKSHQIVSGASGLRSHMIEHGSQNKPYECSICHMKFFFRSELDNHLILHNSTNNGTHSNSEGGIPQPDLTEINSYKKCEFCQNLFPPISFSEHVNSCSLRPENNMVQQSDVDNNIKQETI